MGLDLTDDQRLENYRIRFQLAHNRIKELASYIRITDAAVWGFLGVSFIEIFKEQWIDLYLKIALFSILLIISMVLWRGRVASYQREIVKEYKAIKDYEIILKIDDKHSMTARHKKDEENGRCYLEKEEYVDRKHLQLDTAASFFTGFAFLYLIAWALATFTNIKTCIC